MNNHQNAIFHQITNFLKTPLALLGVDLKNFQFNKICHFANHPYVMQRSLKMKKRIITLFLLSLLTAAPANSMLACGLLDFFLPGPYTADVVSCYNGKIDKEQGYFVMTQGSVYGPDCTLKVYPFNNPQKFTVLRMQQNYCALEAGAIHVTQISAAPPSLKAEYTTSEGSFSASFSGDVTFKRFSGGVASVMKK